MAQREESRLKNDSNDRVGGLQADVKQSKEESKISPYSRLRDTLQPDRQTYPLSLSPAGVSASFRLSLYAPWILNRLSV